MKEENEEIKPKTSRKKQTTKEEPKTKATKSENKETKGSEKTSKKRKTTEKRATASKKEKVEPIKENMEEVKKEEKVIEKEEKVSPVVRPKKQEFFTTKEVIVLILITCAVNFLLVLLFSNRLFSNKKIDEYEIKDENLKQIIETYQNIKDNFYDIDGEVDEKDIVSGAIKGMMESLNDEHSMVVPEDDDTYDVTLEGEYQGLGIEIQRNFTDGKIYILRVFKDSAAEQAGLEPGDVILSIDGESVENMTTDEFGDRVKNGTASLYTIVVSRDGKELSFDVARNHVIIESVTSEMLEKEGKKIGYIIVDTFAANTDTQFHNQLETLENDGMEALIIDLRDNSGGHLSAVQNMISEFLDKSYVIYQMDKKGKIEVTYSTGKETKTYPIVILANGGSASASEVMIGALTEQNGAKLVGTQTFGKGTAQELVTVQATGDQYKITTKKWLTPNGVWIDGVGFDPDYAVSLQDSYYTNPTRENDNQFAKAVEVALTLLKG